MLNWLEKQPIWRRKHQSVEKLANLAENVGGPLGLGLS